MRTTNCINNAIKLEQRGKSRSDRVKMTVEEFKLGRASRGRRNTPSVKVGTTLYAIKYELGGYFTYSYHTHTEAERIIQAMKDNATNTFQFYGFNVVDTPDETLPCIK